MITPSATACVSGRGRVAATLAVALLLSACGSMESHHDVVRAAGGNVPVQSGESAPGVAGPGQSNGEKSSAVPQSGSASTPGVLTPGAIGPGGGSTPQPGTGGPSSVAGPASGTGPRAVSDTAPVTIGNVSTMSGIAGAAQRPGVIGLQAWVRFVNDRGGVNGHQIKLITRDDQGDPNQNAAATQALVEQAKVVAFVSNWATQTQNASADYLQRKNIPVVGGDHTGEKSWGVNPMFFPTAAIGDDTVRVAVAGMAKVALPKGKKKVGILVCVEAAICTHGAQVAEAYAKKIGLDVRYNGSASAASPGYTAECINMKNQGVQALYLLTAASSIRTIAKDCKRQGLDLIYGLGPGGNHEGDFNQDPNFEGASVVTAAFPFTGVQSEAVREYSASMKKYEPEQISNQATASGWASGVVFGAALAKVQGPVTTGKLLEALYTFKNESFGGRTIPLTFSRGPMIPRPCYFHLIIAGGAYVAQNGGGFQCL